MVDHAPAVCRNCGTALEDRFCQSCGQDARELPQRIVPLGAHLLAGAFDLDSRPLSTFLTLLTRPGRLTAAYVSGHRVRYAAPVQVYLWCTAIFFLVHAYAPFVRLDPARGTVASSLSAVAIGDRLPSGLVSDLASRGIPMAAFAARFDAAVSAYLPVLLVAIVAGSGVLFELLFRRERALTHIVFALHWAAFYFALEAARRVLPVPADWQRLSGVLVTAVAAVYLAVAMRVVYGASWAGAAAKTVVVVVIFSALLGVWLASAIEIGLRLARG